MSEEQKKRMVLVMIAKLVEFASRKVLSFVAIDWEHRHVIFRIEPDADSVREFLSALQMAQGDVA